VTCGFRRPEELLDNGVPQRITSLDLTPMPLDVTLVVDPFDESGLRIRERPASRNEQAIALQTNLGRIRQMMGPDDELGLILIGSAPDVIALRDVNAMPDEHFGVRAAVRSYERYSALYDAVAASVLRTTPPDRRHVSLVFTNGVDDASALAGATLNAIVARSDSTVHVFRRLSPAEQARERGAPPEFWTARLLWPPDPRLIEAVARTSGGQVYFQGGLGSLVEPVRQILDDLRQRYVLRYQPAGIPAEGWHEVTVRVTRPGEYDVRARRGYFR
jgi:hypothetical protein